MFPRNRWPKITLKDVAQLVTVIYCPRGDGSKVRRGMDQTFAAAQNVHTIYGNLGVAGEHTPVNTLPLMTIEQLKKHDACPEEFPHYISSCGYIFEHKTFFNVFMAGRYIS